MTLFRIEVEDPHAPQYKINDMLGLGVNHQLECINFTAINGPFVYGEVVGYAKEGSDISHIVGIVRNCDSSTDQRWHLPQPKNSTQKPKMFPVVDIKISQLIDEKEAMKIKKKYKELF